MFPIPGVSITGNPEAIQGWLDNLRRFAGYRGELVETLRWFGEEATKVMKEGHPPGGPHPPAGEAPVYGEHAYIDRAQWLTNSIGYSLEAYSPWEPGQGIAPALPTLMIFATAPHAEAVEYGVPGHSRPYPFFWPTIEQLLPEATERLANVMRRANEFRGT